MSLILDALRRGRGPTTPRQDTNAAQTDAVLQTLGYGRFSPTSPFNRFKRAVGYLVVGVIFSIVLWGSVIWVTQTYFTPEPQMEVINADQTAAQPPAAAVGRGMASITSARINTFHPFRLGALIAM